MKAMKTTGKIKARIRVVDSGRTNTTNRFLTVNVQTCLRKSFIVACQSSGTTLDDLEVHSEP